MPYFSNYGVKIYYYCFGVNLPHDIPDDCFTNMEGIFLVLKPYNLQPLGKDESQVM